MVNFYRDLYPKRAETLAPLTDLCGQKTKFIWTETQESAFQKMKEILAQDAMLTYPEFDQPFVIYTDASERQIGGVVTQNNCPLSFFSKKTKRHPTTIPSHRTRTVSNCGNAQVFQAYVVRAPHNRGDRSLEFNLPEFDAHLR
jgi:hypothetical protein